MWRTVFCEAGTGGWHLTFLADGYQHHLPAGRSPLSSPTLSSSASQLSQLGCHTFLFSCRFSPFLEYCHLCTQEYDKPSHSSSSSIPLYSFEECMTEGGGLVDVQLAIVPSEGVESRHLLAMHSDAAMHCKAQLQCNYTIASCCSVHLECTVTIASFCNALLCSAVH